MVLVVTLAAAACGGGSDVGPSAEPPSTSAAADVASIEPSSTTTPAPATDDGSVSFVAEAAAPTIEVFTAPDRSSAGRLLDAADEVGGRLVFLVEGAADGDWLQVHLPVRPNGSTGWVQRDAVAVSQHSFSVEVQLAAHRMVVRDGPEVVLDVPVGVGTTDTPTPGGTFYIKELLQPPDPTGAYGPYAYGLSGFSNQLDDFAGGDGVIGLHGTDAPEAIGRDVSHGCIRMANEHIVHLVEEVGLPLGTPVRIVA